jgi:hypothetical protein
MENRLELVNQTTLSVLVKFLYVKVKTYATKSPLFNRAKLVPVKILNIQYTIHA